MSEKPLTYDQYLKRKGLADLTINTYENDLRRFMDWCDEQGIEVAFITYDELLKYIQHLRAQNLTPSTVQHYYIAIRHYYDLLVKQEQIEKNPITAIRLTGKQNKPIYHILSIEQLEGLYTHFDTQSLPDPLNALREKVTLGLIIFQGITSGELGKLTTKNINLQKGSITILGSQHRDKRNIALQPQQIMELYDYCQRVRPQLLAQRNLPEETDKLLIHHFTQECDAVRYIVTKLKKKEPTLVNATQIRTSVITRWLRQYNLREVQYLAGHHCIKSTEAYRHNDTEDLQNDIDRFHPSAR